MTSREPTGRPDRVGHGEWLVAVGTRHGKADQLAAAFERVLGARLVTPPDLDTDQFGTFSGEIARRIHPLEAARAKARLGMQLSGLRHGLASEASYGPLPGSGLPGHEELLLFVDDERGIEVVEGYRTLAGPPAGHCAAGVGDLPRALTDGLPAQALIVRPSSTVTARDVVKGITDEDGLHRAIREAAERSADGLAFVEPDLRAHHNPSRRIVLARLAETMAHRLATRCPACDTPGFGRTGTRPGLPCRLCGEPTSLIRAEINGCPACPHHVVTAVPAATADATWCASCNP